MGLTPGSGRPPGEGNGNLLQYSGLGNPMDREAWRATDLAFTKGSAHNLATKKQQSVHTEKRYCYLIYTREIISIVVSILCYKSYCGLAQSHNLLTYELIFKPKQYQHSKSARFSSVQFSSATQPCPTLCDPMNCSMPGLPVHHKLPEFTQTHVHRVSDAIQLSHPLLSPSPPAPNPSQHQGLFQ